jgi:hypothetical protein
MSFSESYLFVSHSARLILNTSSNCIAELKGVKEFPVIIVHCCDKATVSKYNCNEMGLLAMTVDNDRQGVDYHVTTYL